MDDANTGKDHALAHAHVHADEVHDHAGEDKIILKPMLMLMFMFMQEKITWWASWALVGPAFPLLGPFPVINVRYKLRQQPILPTVKFSIWAAAHKPNALRHRGREAGAACRDIFSDFLRILWYFLQGHFSEFFENSLILSTGLDFFWSTQKYFLKQFFLCEMLEFRKMIIVHKNYFSHGPQVVSFQGDWQWIEFHLREMEIGNWIYKTANFMEFKMELCQNLLKYVIPFIHWPRRVAFVVWGFFPKCLHITINYQYHQTTSGYLGIRWYTLVYFGTYRLGIHVSQGNQVRGGPPASWAWEICVSKR